MKAMTELLPLAMGWTGGYASRPPEVQGIREKLGLTQAEAGKIFGGGVNAFSRYERGAAQPSTQMRKLLKIAERHPELARSGLT